jgi:hypothetical protein
MRYIETLKQHTYTPNDYYDYLARVEDAMVGDMAFSLPKFKPYVSEANHEDGYAVEVQVVLVNTAGEAHDWYHGTKAIALSTTSTDGTFAIGDSEESTQGTTATADLKFENGVATFVLVLDGTWAADDTITATVDNDDTKILGYSVKEANHELLKVQADPSED